MSKLSIGQQGIQIETHEKANVMSACTTMGFVICAIAGALILFGSEQWIQIVGAVILIAYIIVWLVVYTTHSIKSPHLLQSEKYRLEKQKIEAGMYENKENSLIELERSSPLRGSTQCLIETSDDIEVEDEH